MQHTSALHVRDFASLCSQNLKANVLLNSDDHEVPIHQKNPAAIMQNIDSNIKQMATDWGMSIEEVEVIIGREKGIVEPSCGVTANAIMKLFGGSALRLFLYIEIEYIPLQHQLHSQVHW